MKLLMTNEGRKKTGVVVVYIHNEGLPWTIQVWYNGSFNLARNYQYSHQSVSQRVVDFQARKIGKQ